MVPALRVQANEIGRLTRVAGLNPQSGSMSWRKILNLFKGEKKNIKIEAANEVGYSTPAANEIG